MQTYNYLYRSGETLEKLLTHMDSVKIATDQIHLIRIHTSIHEKQEAVIFARDLKKAFPEAELCGTSAASVIYNGEIIKDACLISFFCFHKSIVRNGLFMLQKFQTLDRIVEELLEERVFGGSSMALLFVTNNYYKLSSLVHKIKKKYPNLKLAGGVASTAQAPMPDPKKPSFLFDQNAYTDYGVSVCVLNSPNLQVYQSAVLGMDAIGKVCTITGTDGYYLNTINDKNAIAWYKNVLGPETFEQDPDIVNVFPFILSAHKNAIRVVQYDKEQDRIFLKDQIQAGEKVRVSYANPAKNIEECTRLCKEIQLRNIDALFVYSCLLREMLLKNCSEWELQPFRNTNISGAMMCGEIGGIDGECEYFNMAFTLTGISEVGSDSYIHPDMESLNDIGRLEYDNYKMMAYLFQSASHDMYEENETLARDLGYNREQIAQKLCMDEQTGLGNQTQYLMDEETYHFNKLCLISLQNILVLKSVVGRQMCQENFLSQIQQVKQFLEDDQIMIYVYKQDDLILAANETVGRKEFLDCMQALYRHLSANKKVGIVPVYEFSVVVDESGLIEKAELTRATIRKSNAHYMVFFPDIGLEESAQSDMAMLSVIRDALMYDWIIPFYQPIMDNQTGKIGMYEALMRLEGAHGEIYNPMQFLEVAKEYKMYLQLSERMIYKVLRNFQNRDEIVSINLNVQDILSDGITRMIFRQLESMKNPERITFELVESEKVNDYIALEAFVNRVRHYGAKIAIDDFGSGYSNLIKILQLNADYIKIDGEIVRHMTEDRKCHILVETVMFLAKQLKSEVVAEYVENEEIQNALMQLGVQYSQGYFFSQPRRLFGTD